MLVSKVARIFKQTTDWIRFVAGYSVKDELKEREIEDRETREEAIVIVQMYIDENLSWKQMSDLFGRQN